MKKMKQILRANSEQNSQLSAIVTELENEISDSLPVVSSQPEARAGSDRLQIPRLEEMLLRHITTSHQPTPVKTRVADQTRPDQTRPDQTRPA